MATTEQFDAIVKMLQDSQALTLKLVEENRELRRTDMHAASDTTLSRSTAKKVDRPPIDADMSDQDWVIFLDSWRRYKKLTNMNDAGEICEQLRACCSTDVNRLLVTVIGQSDLEKATEDGLLEHIKRVAVKSMPKEVHRLNFTQLRQGEKEPITQFYGRLKEQAGLCQFVISCPPKTCGRDGCDHQNVCEGVSYASDMISQQLLYGLHNKQFQSRILTEAATLTTLEAMVTRLRTLESTEECSQLLQPDETTRAATGRKSRYKDGQSKEVDHQNVRHGSCKHCGRTSHGEGKSMSDRDCPAQKRICHSCRKKGHFKTMCKTGEGRKSKANQAADAAQSDGADDDETLASMAMFL